MTDTIPDSKAASEATTIPDSDAPKEDYDAEMLQWMSDFSEAEPERYQSLIRAFTRQHSPLYQPLAEVMSTKVALSEATEAPSAQRPAPDSQEALYQMAPYMRPTQVKVQ